MTETHPLRFSVDPEHSGLRLAVILSLFGLAALIFVFITLLLPGLGALIALFVSLGIGYLAASLLERQLKRRWPSGRVLELDVRAARLLRKTDVEMQIDGGLRVDVLCWRFEVRGRGRVPRGWYMVACALQQGDKAISAYTFMPQRRFEALAGHERFTVLSPARETRGQPGSDMRLAGEQRRLKDAEYRRWQAGAELTPDDFERYVMRVFDLFAS